MRESPSDIKKIVAHFQIKGEFLGCRPMGIGHINDTYLVEVKTRDGKERYTVQRINHLVFRNPVALMENFEKVTIHIRKKLEGMPGRDPCRETLDLAFENSGRPYHLSPDGNYWRAYRYVDNSHTIDIASNPEQTYQAGRAFGCFQSLLTDLPVEDVNETIPFFHHTPKRFARLEETLRKDACSRAAEAKDAVDFALARRSMISILTDALDSGAIPLRVTHNDTKINNVLFDNATGQAICVIDLDTTMPGTSLFDFGDMVRTATHSVAEDERDLSKAVMGMDMFRALAAGYLEEAREFLTEREISFLVLSGRLITFTIGLRFLTDFLEGNIYFKTHRPGQNLDRARVQFALVRSMEDQEEEMSRTVKEILEG